MEQIRKISILLLSCACGEIDNKVDFDSDLWLWSSEKGQRSGKATDDVQKHFNKAWTRVILLHKRQHKKSKKSTVCPTNDCMGLNFKKSVQISHQEKGAFPHLDQAVRIGPLEPVNPSWTPRVTSVRSGAGHATQHQSLNEKPVSGETITAGSRARQWKQLQPFLDMVQSQENLEHERSSSIRTQLGGNWQRRFGFGTRGKQQALF